MKIIDFTGAGGLMPISRQLVRVMKLTTFFIAICLIQVSAATKAQITLREQNVSLQHVLENISNQSGYDFIYSDQDFKDLRPVNISLDNVSIEKALTVLFEGQPLTYQINDKTVMVRKKESTSLLDHLKQYFTNIEVQGRAVDETGQPLAGATVIVKGTSNSTITDAKGNFSLKNVNPGAVIVISFIGYDKKELQAEQNLGVVKLTLSTNKLDQLQIIAYGQTSRRLSTGNISGVSAEEIEKQPVNNPLVALEGKVAGLLVTQTSGIPGSSVNLQVQGQNSIANGNDPLYVIDGIPYDPNFYSSNSGENTSLFFINPSDIQSIEVLKDASATAIYGSRAANGAILITTKKGKAGATKVDINVQDGFAKDIRMLKRQTTQQYLAMRRETYYNDGITPSSDPNDIGFAPELTIYDQNRYTNWEKVLYGRTAQYLNGQGSISGGSENTQFLISGGYHRETPVFPGASSSITGSSHVNFANTSANKKFKVEFSASYTSNNNSIPSGPAASMFRLPPNAPALYNSDGTLNWAESPQGSTTWLFGQQPLAYTLQYIDKKTNNLNTTATLSYQIIPGLNFSTLLGYNNQSSYSVYTSPLSAIAPEQRAYNQNSASYEYPRFNSYSVEPQLSYKRTIAKGTLDVLIGESIQRQQGDDVTLYGRGYNSESQLQNPGSASVTNVYSQSYIYRYNAIFSRINYNWQDEYLIDLTARRDGSSRFGRENQFHDFGAVGLGWIFTQESLVKDHLPFLSFGKLKGSYGVMGNDQIGNYQNLSLYYNSSLYQGNRTLITYNLPNPYLQWEVNKKVNLGIDLGFFKDRMLLSVDHFINRSSNQLLGYNLPISTGFGGITENFPATVQNSGWEFTLNTKNIQGKDFNWSTSFNLTLPKNKLIAFKNLSTSSYANSLVIGQPVNIIKLYNYLGVDPATGLYVFQDSKGNATYNTTYPDDYYKILSTSPVFYGGMENTFNYKSFTLSFVVNFRKQLGNNVLSAVFGSAGVYFAGPQLQSVLPEWQQPGQIRTVGRYVNYASNAKDFAAIMQYNGLLGSDAVFGDASFVRLQNVSLSWQMPQKWAAKIGMHGLRLFGQGENIATFTRYKQIDPEAQNAYGVPPLMVATFGLKATL